MISLFSPNSVEPIVKIFAHNGSVNDASFTSDGNYLTSIGSDNKMKVFDIRKTFNELYSYSFSREPTTLDVSQNGLVSVSFSDTLVFWKDLFKSRQDKPYFKHTSTSRNMITDCKFCPYEEFMGVTYNNKFENIFVPGSGSQSFDTYEANVAGIKKQIRENLVHQIIEKVILLVTKGNNHA